MTMQNQDQVSVYCMTELRTTILHNQEIVISIYTFRQLTKASLL